MKKFLLSAIAVIALVLLLDTAYYRWGFYIPIPQTGEVEVWATTDSDTIYVDKGHGYEPFVIKGVDLGVGIPGHWATDYAIDEETYLRWFKMIKEMGANTIRVYTILHDDFYNAFYEYNKDNDDPLYLLHGLWVNDYVMNSHHDAYDPEFLGELLKDSHDLVDVLHGNKKLSPGDDKGSGFYTKDVSEWVLGYIPGVEWEVSNVVYTDQMNEDKSQYQGKYFFTEKDASPYEAMLAQLGDHIVSYEVKRYGQQRLIAFSNWPATDPFVYPATVSLYRFKMACVDVEHIKTTNEFLSGQFASYHVYSYFPDYLEGIRETENVPSEELDQRLGHLLRVTLEQRLERLERPEAVEMLGEIDYTDPSGKVNTYYSYLKLLADYHTMPVVISEFGITTGRGMAQRDANTGRNQGHLSEQEQGDALVSCWQDIMAAGCAGGCVFSWQDEWFKRTWNTFPLVDLQMNPYWSDVQTNEQYFGLLAFDPGEEKSICYVDGECSEWTESDMVVNDGGYSLSVKYDECYMYFLVRYTDKDNAPIYIPIDTTPKTGSSYCENYNLNFDCAADFLLVLNGNDDSRLLVQERYDSLRATYSQEYFKKDAYTDPPAKDSPVFQKVNLPLTLKAILPEVDPNVPTGEYYESGLLTYGNANPLSEEFNSIADFYEGEDCVEIRLPWQLLNFGDPTMMRIHDDYYECYGVEFIAIDSINVGVGDGKKTFEMESLKMEGLGRDPAYHERLKDSYYILQDYWAGENN